MLIFIESGVSQKHFTYSTVQSPSWESNRFAACQEIPRISWNLKFRYRTHKPPSPVPILGQPNPVHIPTFHLLEIHPNIIHPSTPRSPQWSLSLRFPHQEPIHPPLLTHTRHMPSKIITYEYGNSYTCISYTVYEEAWLICVRGFDSNKLFNHVT